jgi:superfamily II DNA or RNA helicase
MLLVQAIGRGLRTADGKSELILLDHTDTVVNLGLPSDIRFDRLCDGKMALGSEVEKKPPLPKCCPSCSALKPPGVRKCPSCGFEPAVKAAGVETVEGELIELTGRKKAAAKDNREATWSEKVQFIGELKLYAQRTGKAEGWIAHKYKAKFGVFPNDPRVKYAPAASSLSAQVDSWIRAQNIRWIKSQEAQRRRA